MPEPPKRVHPLAEVVKDIVAANGDTAKLREILEEMAARIQSGTVRAVAASLENIVEDFSSPMVDHSKSLRKIVAHTRELADAIEHRRRYVEIVQTIDPKKH